jgi:hypothetical protein
MTMTDLRSRLRDAASGVEPSGEALKLVRRRVRRRQLSRRIGTIVVAVLVAAAGTLAAIRAIEPTGRRRPAGPPPSGTLVFLRTDRRQVSFGHDTYIHADPRIMTEDLATGSLGEVPVPAGQIRSPLVSPDGTQIAVSIGTLQGEAASWETGVVNADGTELTTVLGCGVHPCQSFPTAWSPDGRELLAYSTTRPGPALVVLPLDGSRSRPFVPVPEYFGGATWSPDGKTIALSGAARFGAPSISLLDSATGRVERQIEPSGLELISGLAWAPDGRTIAISARTDPGSSSIFIVNVDDGSLRRLTSCSGCQDSAPAWSPDGRYLAFSRGDDFGGDLYLMRPDATGLRRVTTGAEIDCCVSWATALARPSLKSASPLGFPNGLDAVAFGDASHGWAAGTDGILATTDGGSRHCCVWRGGKPSARLRSWNLTDTIFRVRRHAQPSPGTVSRLRSSPWRSAGTCGSASPTGTSRSSWPSAGSRSTTSRSTGGSNASRRSSPRPHELDGTWSGIAGTSMRRT